MRVHLHHIDVPLSERSAALDGMRIAHISDLHFSRWNQTLIDAQLLLLDEKYDLLCATGDFGTFRRVWRKTVSLAQKFFLPVSRRGPVYAVLGNHDHPCLADHLQPPLTLIKNKCHAVTHNGVHFNLVGVEQTLPRPAEVEPALLQPMQAAFNLMLAHFPSTALRLPHGVFDLVLSGHTHGGQIRIPGIGCAWPNDRIPRRMAKGLHRLPAAMLHVSPGIGRSLPIPIRINCPPEITMLTLRAKPT